MDKIVFIDVDGTLTTGLSSWEKIHHHFEETIEGMVNMMKANELLWESGEIDYNTWAKMDVKLWKGLPYSELYRALLPPELIVGAQKGISMLKDNGFSTILVSGGINVMVDEVRNLVGAHQSFSNKICEKDGLITGEVEVPVGNSKVTIVDRIVKQNQIDIGNTYAIGDHVNDLEMFEYVGYALGVNVKRDIVREHANDSISMTDFTQAAEKIIVASNQADSSRS